MKIHALGDEGPSNEKHTRRNEAWAVVGKDVMNQYTPKRSIEQSEEVQGCRKTNVVELSLSKNTKLIERRKTLLSLLVKNERVFKWVLGFYKHRATTTTLSVLWIMCTLNALSICLREQLVSTSIYLPIQIIYTINFCLHNFVFIRIDIIKELGKHFNFWFTIFNAVSFHICFVMLWGLDANVFFMVLHSFSSMFVLIALDAHAAKHLAIIRASTLFGLISYIPIAAVLLFHLIDFQNERIHYGNSDVELINLRLQANDNLTTLIIYLLRIIYNHIILKKSTTIAFLSDFYEVSHKETMYQKAEQSGAPQSNIEPNGHKKADLEMDSVLPVDASEPCFVERVGGSLSISGEDRKHDEEQKMAFDQHIPIDGQKYLVIGIQENSKLSYDSHLTLYHIYLSESYPHLAKVLKSRFYNSFGIAICIACTFLSLPLAFGYDFGVAFKACGIIVTMTGIAFMLVQMLTTCNIFMFRFMVRSFDYWYVMFLILKVYISAGVLCNWDIRMIFWLYAVVAMKWCIMVDTFSLKNRKSSYISLVGIAWAFFVGIVCKVHVGKTFSHDRFIQVAQIQLMSSRITLSTSAFSIALFLIRFFWSFHKNPRRILFITENIRVEQIPPIN